jgi:hypothetical protein
MIKQFIENLAVWVITFASAWALISHAAKAGDAVSATRNKPAAYEQCSGEIFARTELSFDRSKPDGSMIAEEEFSQFLDEAVLPWFPEGLAGLADGGESRGSGGPLLRQDSVVLALLYPPGDDESGAYIEKIRDAYSRRFEQNSVLRVDSESCVSF